MVELLLSQRCAVNPQANGSRTPCWEAAFEGQTECVSLLVAWQATFDLPDDSLCTPLFAAAQENKPDCIAMLAAARANLEGAQDFTPISMAAQCGGDESVRILAMLGARLVDPAPPNAPFWKHFGDSKGRIRDPALWEWIVRKGGDVGTDGSLRRRIRMLKKAGLGYL